MALGAVVAIATSFIKTPTPAGQPLPYGSVTGEPFAVQVTRIPTNILEQAVAANRNPFNLSKGFAPSGLQIMKDELARRKAGGTYGSDAAANNPGAGTAPALSAPASSPSAAGGGLLGTLPLWLTVVLAGGLGYVVYQMFKKA